MSPLVTRFGTFPTPEPRWDRSPASSRLWSRGPGVGPGRPDMSGELIYVMGDQNQLDDGSGTFTGSAGSSIAWPTSIWHHLGVKLAGLSTSDFEVGSSTFGSFVEARTSLNLKVTGDWDCLLAITDKVRPMQVAERLMSVFPLAIYRSMLDSKFKAVVYKLSPDSFDYFKAPNGSSHVWMPGETDEPRAGLSPYDAVVNEVHVRYGHYAPTGELTKETYVSPDGSDDGNGTRDQTGAITASNDREARAVRSKAIWGQRSITVDIPEVYTDEIAVVVRNWLFDMYWRRKVVLTFVTGQRAIQFEPLMATLVSSTLQDRCPIPYSPLDGGAAKSWGDLKFYGRAARQPGLVDRYRMTLVEIT